MKYEVIGWTDYDNKKYADFAYNDYDEYCAARLAIIEDIRKNKYMFSSDNHYYGVGCVPVLNNGMAFRCSGREWGAVMAEAWNTPNNEGLGYAFWYLGDFSVEDLKKVKTPKSFVDDSKILPSGTVFDTAFPSRYMPYTTFKREDLKDSFLKLYTEERKLEKAPGIFDMTLFEDAFWQIYDEEKTVEVRLNDEKRQKLKVGDIIMFFMRDHAEQCIASEVIALKKFPSFVDLFSSELFSKTGFEGYTTEEASNIMYKFYKKEDEQKYGVLAIEIKIIKSKWRLKHEKL